MPKMLTCKLCIVRNLHIYMPKDKIKWGIIGIGAMGESHAQTLLSNSVKNAELNAVCDIDFKCKNKFPSIKFYTNSNDLFKDKSIDAVLVATPHTTHVPLGIQSLKSEKHTLVEKPLSITTKKTLDLINFANSCDVSFGVMLNQRTNPIYKTLKQMIVDNELGEIQRIQWTITDWFRSIYYYSTSSWRASWKGEGGGVLINQSIHQLDLWQWLFGMPDSVHANINLGRFHNIEVEDDVTALFKYNNGSHGLFVTTTGETPGVNRLEVASDNGLMIIENNKIIWNKNEISTTEYLKRSKKSMEKPNIKVEELKFENINFSTERKNIIQNFSNQILGIEKLYVDGKEGLNSVELMNAMIYSGLNKTEVSIPINSENYEKKLDEIIAENKR